MEPMEPPLDPPLPTVLLLFGICVCLVLPHGRMNILLGLFPLFNRIKYLHFYCTFVGVCYIYNNNNNRL